MMNQGMMDPNMMDPNVMNQGMMDPNMMEYYDIDDDMYDYDDDMYDYDDDDNMYDYEDDMYDYDNNDNNYQGCGCGCNQPIMNQQQEEINPVRISQTQIPPFAPPGQQTPSFGLGPAIGPQFRPPFAPPVGSKPSFRPPFGTPWPSGMQRFRRCFNRMSLVTLHNRSRFWFYPTDIRRQRLIGFRWRRNRWEPYSIDVARIANISCN